MTLNYKHLAFFLFVFTGSVAQVGIGTTTPQGALDVESNNSGVVVPRVALTSRTDITTVINPQGGNVVNGTLVWNTATAGTAPNNVAPGFYYYTHPTWTALGGDTTRQWSLSGNAITNPATDFIGTTSNQDFRVRTNNANRFNFSSNGRLRSYDNGIVNQPTYSWMGDEDTGMWRPTADALGFSTGGSERMRIHNNGISFFNTTINQERFRFECNVLTANAIAMAVYNTGGNGSNQWTLNAYNSTNDGGSIMGYTTSTNNNNMAVNGVNAGTNGIGVRGLHIPTTGAGVGVYGTSNSSNADGVWGAIPTTGAWLGYGGIFTGGLGYANGLYNLSDARIKTNVVTIPSALDKIQQIRGVSYNHDNKKYPYLFEGDTKKYLGFIAQEIKEVFPEVVTQKMVKTSGTPGEINTLNQESGKELLNVVDYTQIIPVLVEAIKEQQQTIETLKARVEALENN